MIPDDTAGQPLTAGERAALADLERRLLLDAPVAQRDGGGGAPAVVARAAPVRTPPGRRTRPAGSGRPAALSPVVPLVALLGTGCVLVAVLAVTGGGVLGAAAVVGSVLATALVWPLLPAGLGGPVRPPRRPYRTPGQIRGRG